MSAGTITLANNSDAVTGNGTTFTTDLGAGDFIVVTVGGVPYTLPVKSVTSNTSLTLVSNFTGPAQSGSAWSAVPRTTLNMVTAALVVQSAEALRGLNYDKQNWQAVFSGSENITVMLPDGSKYPGPSWKYLADNMATKTGGAVPVAQGGTGATTAAAARTKLGLDDVAMKTDGVVSVKDGGTGGNTKTSAAVGLGTLLMNNANIQPTASSMDDFQGTLGTAGECYTVSATNTHNIGNWPMAAWSTTNKAYGWGALLVPRFATGSATNIQLYVGDEGSCNAYLRVRFGNAAYRSWCALLSDKNTTVDSNGFVKKASPVVKIYSDGVYETNVESEGATVVREGVGVYLIRGVMGMNADRAWGGNGGGIELPKDVNGQPRVWVDYDVDADGSIVIRTYHRTHPDAPEFARNLIGTKDDAGVFTETVQNGEPIDIPEDVFISVRVEMPADSAYNLSLLESRAEQQSLSAFDDNPDK